MRHFQGSLSIVLAWCLLAIVALIASDHVAPDESNVERSKPLIYTDEDLREIRREWERMWNSDQPSRSSPSRVRGGVI